MIKKDFVKTIPLLVCLSIMTAFISGSFLSVIYLETSIISLMLISAVAVLLAELITYNKISVFISIGMVVVHTVFSFVYIPVFSDISYSINLVFNDLYNMIFWNYMSLYSGVFQVKFALCFVIGFSIYLFYVKLKNPVLSLMVLFIYIFSLQLFFAELKDTEIYVNFFVSIAGILFLMAYKNYDKAKIKKSVRLWVKYVTPVISVVLVCTIIVSLSVNTGINNDFRNWLNDLINTTPGSSTISALKKELGFFENKSGEIGGPISIPDKRHAFDVTVYAGDGTEELKTSTIYLRGTSWDHYERSVWDTKTDDDDQIRTIGTEFIGKYFFFDGDTSRINNLLLNNENNVLQKQTFVVSNKRFESKTIFHSLLTSGIISDPQAVIYYDLSGHTYYNDQTVDQYSVDFYKLIRNSTLRELTLGSNYSSFDDYKTFLDMNLRTRLEQNYLQISGEIPLDRVRDLALTITAGIENDYLKAAAIETYLKENYTYDLNPKKLPRNKDLVSNFLFEDPRGYCVYYATAMVMLCRSIGIPARYVTGYRVDYVESYKTTGVYNTNSHAWTEVFIPEFGWVTYDAVSPAQFSLLQPERPGNSLLPNYTPPKISASNMRTPAPSGATTDSPETTEPEDSATPSEDTINNPPTPTKSFPRGTASDGAGIIIIIAIAAIIMTGVVLLFIINKKRKPKGILRKKPSDLFIEFLCAKEYLGYIWTTGETVSEYFKKLNEEEFYNISKSFEKSFYKEIELTDKEYDEIVDKIKDLTETIILQDGKYRWYKFKYRFYKDIKNNKNIENIKKD